MDAKRFLVVMIALVAVSAIFLGIMVLEGHPLSSSQVSQAPAPTSQCPASPAAGFAFSNTTSGLITYHDYAYGFNVSYPQTWPTAAIAEAQTGPPTPPWPVSSNGEALLSIGVPISAIASATPEAYDIIGNAEIDATIAIGVSSDTVDLSECDNGQPTQVNGTTFYQTYSHDVGAGVLYDYVTYEAEQFGRCYAVKYTFSSPSVPTGFNYKTLVPLLDRAVLQTFRFGSNQ